MKKHWITSILALILALTMVLGCGLTVGCADDPAEDDPSDEQEQTGNTPTSGEEIPEEEQRIPTDLPETTFDNAEFHIFQWTVSGQYTPGTRWMPWEEGDVDQDTGDLINDSVFDRNATVEEQYQVVISMEYGNVDNVDTPYMTSVRNNHNTGDDLYQLITLRSLQSCELTLELLMTDMSESPYIDLSKPWWNQDSVASLRTGDSNFWASSELLIRDKGATACIFYNARIAEDNGFTEFYELADAGDWTMEALCEAAEVCALDNGDGVVDDNDIWGAVCGDDTVNYLYNGAGLKFAEINEAGVPEYLFGDEESITVLKDIFDYVMYADFYANTYSNLKCKEVKFINDNVLFFFGMIKDVTTLRSMTTDYGVLPIPKYDEFQDNYSSLVWMHHDSVLGIPAVVKNQDMAQVVLEALSAESYYTVYRDFYDTVILGRSARDQQSKEMLEVVFNTRSYDPGLFWDNTNFSGAVLRLSAKGTSDIASLWGAYSTAIEKRFSDDLPELIAELN
ncbi:MAG: hypothetical protein IJW40_00495 [Clostridia bacterium]|nr:hypothetical protein [Clostridia bacterium]